MPKPQKILEGLQLIVDRYTNFTLIWHLLVYAFLIALIAGYTPSASTFAILLSIPLFSVAIFAWITKNPFNGIVFLAFSLFILIQGFNAPAGDMIISSLSYMIAGVAMILFGLVYPHFIRTSSIYAYLFRSPFGLIPCPTVSTIVGFVLLFDGLENGLMVPSIILVGLFYGLFGTLKLKVYIDVVLVIGSLALLLKYLLS